MSKGLIAIRACLALAVLSAGVGLATYLIRSAPAPARAEELRGPAAVRYQVARRTELREAITAYGRARALREANLAFQLQGHVAWIASGLDVGFPVVEGQELVRLDARQLEQTQLRQEAELARAAAAVRLLTAKASSLKPQLDSAQGELRLVRGELEQAVTLSQRGTLSERELNARRRAVFQAERVVIDLEAQLAAIEPEQALREAERRGAQAALDETALRLAQATLRAPFAGTITLRAVQLGSYVLPGQAALRLIDPGSVEVELDVPASRQAQVRVGAPVALRTTRTGPVVWRGALVRVSPEIRERQRVFSAFVRVGADFAPGAFVLGEVTGPPRADALTVPRSALVDGSLYVLRPAGEGQPADSFVVERRTPRLAEIVGDLAVVEAGLEPGERVVVRDLELIDQGSRVRGVELTEPAR